MGFSFGAASVSSAEWRDSRPSWTSFVLMFEQSVYESLGETETQPEIEAGRNEEQEEDELWH